MSARSKLEQETVIRWDRASALAEAWTAAVAVKNLLVRRGFSVEVSGGGWKAILPQKAVRIRSAAALARRRPGVKPPTRAREVAA